MIKRLVQRLLKSFGFELIRSDWYGERLPGWLGDSTPGNRDVMPDDWSSHVLDMSNRSYRPASPAYRRGRHGDDHRLKYLLYFLDLRGARTLELGPLEGHHSVILEKLGVRENIAVELRDDNLAKCQFVKQRYGLDRTTFVQQNIEDLYSGTARPLFEGPFDLVFCCGLLYHLPDPGLALKWFRDQAPTLFLGTHYVEIADLKRYSAPMFEDCTYQYGPRNYRAMRYREGGARDPISGASHYSIWPFEQDLIRLLGDVGYRRVSVLGKDIQNRTPHITLLAEVG